MSRHPMVKWAQRSDEVYIIIDLQDAQDVKLKLEPEGKLFFSATSGVDKTPYELDLELYDKVDVNESKASVGSRNICYIVRKAENKWWSRLLKQEGKPPIFLKVDWNKWVEEDEEEEESEDKLAADMDLSKFDFSKLSMGGADDAEDYEDDDGSDTEEEDEEEAVPTEEKEAPHAADEPVDKKA